MRRKKGAAWSPLWAAGCSAALFCLLYAFEGMYPFGKGSILITDLYSQYAPLLYRFYDVVTGEKNLFLDLSVSGGANLYADTINEVINPFNYLLLPFGRDRLYQAINVLLAAYGSAAAASCCLFLRKVFGHRENRAGLEVVLSLCYAFSGYMAYNYQIIKWMYFPVLFPLFCLALGQLLGAFGPCSLRRGRAYILLLGYQLALSVQLGFMTLLFTLFASAIYFYTCVPKQERTARMCRLGLCTLAGLCLSAVVLVPALRGLFFSARSGENLSYPEVMKRHGLDDLFERLFQVGQPVLLGLLAAEGLGRLGQLGRFGRLRQPGQPGRLGKGKRLAAWRRLSCGTRFWLCLNAFLWLTVLLEPANLLWHLGSYVCFPVRYGYMAVLCLAVLVQRLWSGSAKKPAPGGSAGGFRAFRTVLSLPCLAAVAAVAAVAAAAAALAWTLAWRTRLVQAFSSLAISSVCPAETAAAAGICALLFAGALCAALACRAGIRTGGGRWGTGAAVLCSLACGFCFYAMIFLPPDYAVRQENEAAYARMTRESHDLPEGEETEKLRLLEREKEDPDLPINAALVNRKGSVSGYFPTEERLTKETFEGLGYLTPWVSVRSVGGTQVSDSLLRELTVLERGAEETGQEPDSPLARQESWARWVGAEGVLERLSLNREGAGEPGTAVLTLEGERTIYLDAGQPAGGLVLQVNGQPVQIAEQGQTGGEHRLIELGSFAAGQVEIRVSDTAGNPLAVEGMEIGLLDEKEWEKQLEELKRAGARGQTDSARILPAEQYEISERKGKLCLTVEAGRETVLCLPFLALEGWSCVQNGWIVDIVPLLGGLMGISLSEGQNELTLSFVPPGLYAGMALSLLGLLLWVVLTVCSAAGKGDCPGRLESLAGGLYRAILAAGIAGIYAIPTVGLVGYLAWKAGYWMLYSR
ncbi:MAG: YfhO family protein [Eubacteriales bacterium]|nr:YfhO family protein [Eubacteriales bacterium]